jgi:hypothetical protein
MTPAEKLTAFGLKAIAHETGVNLVTVYRWRDRLAEGLGVSDSAKRKIMAATAGTPHAFSWADFAIKIEAAS